MKRIDCNDYEELSRRAAGMVAEAVRENPKEVLGFATGSTPLGMYAELIRLYREGKVDFSQVTTFNLDEYYPIQPDDPESYHHFMWENLFSKINVKKENVHIPDGAAVDPEAECARYTEAIRRAGGIGVQILGVGHNGHIGFNEPGESLHVNTHRTGLTKSTIDANARFFEREEDVPRQALTMGIGDILRARKILLLISGEDKKRVVGAIETQRITTEVPATLLHLHADCTMLVC